MDTKTGSPTPTGTITVLGVGNVLMGDEGFGVRAVEYLRKNHRFPPSVEVMDGGTSGVYLAPVIEDSRRLLIIDALEMDGAAGEIHQLSLDDLRGAGLQGRISPHQVGLLEIIDLCRLRDKAPEVIKVIGIIPQEMSLGLELSPAAAGQLQPVAKLVAGQIEEWTGETLTPAP